MLVEVLLDELSSERQNCAANPGRRYINEEKRLRYEHLCLTLLRLRVEDIEVGTRQTSVEEENTGSSKVQDFGDKDVVLTCTNGETEGSPKSERREVTGSGYGCGSSRRMPAHGAGGARTARKEERVTCKALCDVQ